MTQSWRTRCWSHISHRFEYEYSGICFRKKTRHVAKLRVTNKVTLRDQKHQSNTLSLEVVRFGSSKASKPAAPYGQTRHSAALVLARQPISWQPNLKQATLSNQQCPKGDFSLPVEASNHWGCLSARAANEELQLSAGTAVWVGGWWGANLGSINRSPLSIFCPLPTLKSMGKPIVPRPSVD